MAAATTSGERARAAGRDGKPARPAGPDGVTVTLLSVAGFLVILALLGWQVRATPARPARPVVVVRRVYETRVVETVVGARGGGSSVTQSVSSSGVPAATAGPAPSTRSS